MGIVLYIMHLSHRNGELKTSQNATVGRSTNRILKYKFLNKMFYTILAYLQHRSVKPSFII